MALVLKKREKISNSIESEKKDIDMKKH